MFGKKNYNFETVYDSKVLCCLYDKVAKKYFAPSTFDNVECAKRDAEMLFKEHFGKRSKDYTIVQVGYFFPNCGIVNAFKEPTLLLDGAVFIFSDDEEAEA